MASQQTHLQPSPQLFFSTVNAYQRTEALKAAIGLEIFTAIGEGNQTAATIARRCRASERGTRMLCDFLVISGFLSKEGSQYALTGDSATFLDRRSPGYMGGAIGFLLNPMMLKHWHNLADAVRKGGTSMSESDVLAPDHPVWVEFARSMAPLMAMPAELLANYLKADEGHKWKILGLAVGHGLYGIAIARRNPHCDVYVVDWPNVLQVAQENAIAAGLGKRYHTIPGSAFEVEYGTGYDIVLIPNFLHHFDPPTCEKLLRKAHAALKPGGRVVILEFVPNDDRVSPPQPAGFSLMMLVSTESGDAYTYPEFEKMLHNAGFRSSDKHPLVPDFFTVVVGHK
ncbi:MAG TPA: methyltransferase [Terriglobales bacterium]|nr:methyltransferase [Terriglobales bacterium]